MEEPSSLRILVVEDDADARENLRDILELDGHRISTAGSAAEVMRHPDLASFSALILDRKLPDSTAEEMLPSIRRAAPGASVVIVTGYSDLHGAIAALRQGASDYILKPLNPGALRASLARIADRRRLALAKERSEAAFRNLVEAAECLIVIFRADRSILYFSPFAERVTGYSASEVLARAGRALPALDRLLGPIGELVDRGSGGERVAGFEKPIVCIDGSSRWIVWNARRLDDFEGGPAVLAVGQDITELKRAQDRALQAERLAAIGQMVAGLAHESRNALQRSQACLEMLAYRLEDRPEALELASGIQAAQDDLQRLYEEVRTYAAPLALDRRECRLGEVLRGAWGQLEWSLRGRDARLVEAGEGDDSCLADGHRLGQVFRNILDNSIAACHDPVVVTAEWSRAVLDDRPAIRVALRDNGPGLSPEQRRNLFEPFFTTKTQGTGLGMPIARRIVEAHRGSIEAGTRGPGAEIVITLPRGDA